MTVTAANIVAGAIVGQVSLVVIMFVGASMIHRDVTITRWVKDHPTYSNLAWMILALLLFSIGMLALSDELAQSWRPLFSGLSYSGVSWSKTLFFVFVAAILVVTRLVAATGGSIDSPFQPLYFLIPTLALLLREPTPRILVYASAVALSFSWLVFSFRPTPAEYRERNRWVYCIVGILCLALACFIGIYTRPLP